MLLYRRGEGAASPAPLRGRWPPHPLPGGGSRPGPGGGDVDCGGSGGGGGQLHPHQEWAVLRVGSGAASALPAPPLAARAPSAPGTRPPPPRQLERGGGARPIPRPVLADLRPPPPPRQPAALPERGGRHAARCPHAVSARTDAAARANCPIGSAKRYTCYDCWPVSFISQLGNATRKKFVCFFLRVDQYLFLLRLKLTGIFFYSSMVQLPTGGACPAVRWRPWRVLPPSGNRMVCVVVAATSERRGSCAARRRQRRRRQQQRRRWPAAPSTCCPPTSRPLSWPPHLSRPGACRRRRRPPTRAPATSRSPTPCPLTSTPPRCRRRTPRTCRPRPSRPASTRPTRSVPATSTCTGRSGLSNPPPPLHPGGPGAMHGVAVDASCRRSPPRRFRFSDSSGTNFYRCDVVLYYTVYSSINVGDISGVLIACIVSWWVVGARCAVCLWWVTQWW